MGIVTIASNSGSARTSSSESEVKQLTTMPHVIFYRTNGVRRSVTPRKELNQILSLVLINLKYTLLSEHMYYKSLYMHVQCRYMYNRNLASVILFHLCRQE